MRFPLERSFREERSRWRLHHTCEHCVHYDPAADRCVHGYPTYDSAAEAERGLFMEIFYCKEFELL